MNTISILANRVTRAHREEKSEGSQIPFVEVLRRMCPAAEDRHAVAQELAYRSGIRRRKKIWGPEQAVQKPESPKIATQAPMVEPIEAKPKQGQQDLGTIMQETQFATNMEIEAKGFFKKRRRAWFK